MHLMLRVEISGTPDEATSQNLLIQQKSCFTLQESLEFRFHSNMGDENYLALNVSKAECMAFGSS